MADYERSRALLFARGLSNHLNSEVMREPPSDVVRRHSSGSRRPHELAVVQQYSRGSNRMAAIAARVSTGGTMAGTPTEFANPTRYKRSSDLQLGLCVRPKKLTDSERAQLMKEGRCFKCRASGHLVKNYPEVLPNDIRK